MNIFAKIKNWFAERRKRRQEKKELEEQAYKTQKAKFDLGEIVYDTFTCGNAGVVFTDVNGEQLSWTSFFGEVIITYRVDEHLTFRLRRFYMDYMDRLFYGNKFEEDYYCEVTYYIDNMLVPWGKDYVALTKKAIEKIRQDAANYLENKELSIKKYMDNLREYEDA